MPSPFPGMDPYLESPHRWMSVHGGLITFAMAELNRVLPPHYVASISERLTIAEPEREIYPDVYIVEDTAPARSKRPRVESGMTTAVADPPLRLKVESATIREIYIDILAAPEDGRIITTIEILSFSNKKAGSASRKQYLQKQQETLESHTHLVEIDLLRRGKPAIAPLRLGFARRKKWHYLASLHRASAGNDFEAWPISVRQRLPKITVPLAGEDPDVVLDLQKVLDRCYDEGAYERRLDYRGLPYYPLETTDAAWADRLLKQQGLRPKGAKS
jgi:hypothetical protein